MNTDFSPPNDPREDLESRLTALLLGELPADEAAALRQAISSNAELAALYERLKLTIELVRETAANPAEPVGEEAAPLRMSSGRREELLQHFKTVAPKEFARPRERVREWFVPLSAAAAVGIIAGYLVLSFLRPRFQMVDYSTDLPDSGDQAANRKIEMAKTPPIAFSATNGTVERRLYVDGVIQSAAIDGPTNSQPAASDSHVNSMNIVGYVNVTNLGAAVVLPTRRAPGMVAYSLDGLAQTSDLVLKSASNDWTDKSSNDNGLSLFKTVTGDFNSIVQIIPPNQNSSVSATNGAVNNYNNGGLAVRLPQTGPPDFESGGGGGAVFTDNFATAHNYVTAGITNTIWDGVYDAQTAAGVGDFPGVNDQLADSANNARDKRMSSLVAGQNFVATSGTQTSQPQMLEPTLRSTTGTAGQNLGASTLQERDGRAALPRRRAQDNDSTSGNSQRGGEVATAPTGAIQDAVAEAVRRQAADFQNNQAQPPGRDAALRRPSEENPPGQPAFGSQHVTFGGGQQTGQGGVSYNTQNGFQRQPANNESSGNSQRGGEIANAGEMPQGSYAIREQLPVLGGGFSGRGGGGAGGGGGRGGGRRGAAVATSSVVNAQASAASAAPQSSPEQIVVTSVPAVVPAQTVDEETRKLAERRDGARIVNDLNVDQVTKLESVPVKSPQVLYQQNLLANRAMTLQNQFNTQAQQRVSLVDGTVPPPATTAVPPPTADPTLVHRWALNDAAGARMAADSAVPTTVNGGTIIGTGGTQPTLVGGTVMRPLPSGSITAPQAQPTPQSDQSGAQLTHRYSPRPGYAATDAIMATNGLKPYIDQIVVRTDGTPGSITAADSAGTPRNDQMAAADRKPTFGEAVDQADQTEAEKARQLEQFKEDLKSGKIQMAVTHRYSFDSDLNDSTGGATNAFAQVLSGAAVLTNGATFDGSGGVTFLAGQYDRGTDRAGQNGEVSNAPSNRSGGKFQFGLTTIPFPDGKNLPSAGGFGGGGAFGGAGGVDRNIGLAIQDPRFYNGALGPDTVARDAAVLPPTGQAAPAKSLGQGYRQGVPNQSYSYDPKFNAYFGSNASNAAGTVQAEGGIVNQYWGIGQPGSAVGSGSQTVSDSQLTGYVDTSAKLNLRAGNSNVPNYAFSKDKADGFNLNAVELDLEKKADVNGVPIGVVNIGADPMNGIRFANSVLYGSNISAASPTPEGRSAPQDGRRSAPSLPGQDVAQAQTSPSALFADGNMADGSKRQFKIAATFNTGSKGGAENKDSIEVETIPIKHANASGISALIGNLFPNTDRGATQVGSANNLGQVAAYSDQRTGSLVVTAPKELMPSIKQIVQELDNIDANTLKMYSIKLHDSDPQTVAALIQDLFATNSVAQAKASSAAKAVPQNKLEEDKPAAKPMMPAPVPQPEIMTRENAFSTFSMNVSDVSFKTAQASLEKGALPEPASIRSEEFINAFDYRDPMPAPGAPLAFAWGRARDPFAQNRDLLRFSVKTAAAGREPGKPLNLVLLLDTSGSMERADRVRIIHEALRVLASQLTARDTLSVVTFARTARLWVDGIAGDKAGAVADELSGITPQGGTNLEEAMKLAYQTAQRHYQAAGVNRVVLLTDGAANLGDVDPDALKKSVESNRKQGIVLDCYGVGWEDYNDDMLETLARGADGRYGFLNSPESAGTEFAGELAGALHVAAQDLKAQVEFNPARVTSWRQIGYAKLQLTKQQFRDNTVAAAEIGAAEAGNAMYAIEVNPNGQGPIATVRVRYRDPGTSNYHESEWAVPYNGTAPGLAQADDAMRLSATAAEFSEWLANSPFAGEVTPDGLLTYLKGVPEDCGADDRASKLEWMIRAAKSITGK